MLFLNSIELFEVKTNVFSDSYKFICFDDLILSGLKIRLLCTYISQNSFKSLIFFFKNEPNQTFYFKKVSFFTFFVISTYQI